MWSAGIREDGKEPSTEVEATLGHCNNKLEQARNPIRVRNDRK